MRPLSPVGGPAPTLRPGRSIGRRNRSFGAATAPRRGRCLVSIAMASQASTPTLSAPDVQASVPTTQVKADGTENLYHADFECFVDLEPRQAGVHMSRFEEIVAEAIDEVVLGEAFRAEILAAHIAERVRERQHGRRAEVSVKARYPETVSTPASGQE